MIKRWAIYLWESYNPLRWILFSGLVGLGVRSMLNLVGKSSIPFNWYQALLVVANVFLFFYTSALKTNSVISKQTRNFLKTDQYRPGK